METSPPAGAVLAGNPALFAALETLELQLEALREEGRYRRFVFLHGAPRWMTGSGSTARTRLPS